MRTILALLTLIAVTSSPVLGGSSYTPPAPTPGASATPAGSSGDIQTNGGSGAFGSITPASGLAAFMATATSSNFKTLVTDELAPDGASSKVIFALGSLSIATGKTATFSNTLTFTGTDSTSFSLPSTSGGLLAANATTVLSSTNIIPGEITFYVKSQAITTSANPRDIATFTVPSAITRWIIRGNTTVTNPGWFVNETQTGTMAAGTLAAFDAAAGGGTQLLATTAPAATSNPTFNGWPANTASASSTSSSIVIRQMANSVNSGTISFYITIIPIP